MLIFNKSALFYIIYVIIKTVIKMDCIFCKIINKEIPSKILYEDDLCLVIMDVNPNVDGHSLIIPKKHYNDYLELDNEITTHIFDVAKKMGQKLMSKLDAKSVTLLINYGDDQVVKHFHMHLLPDFGTETLNRTTRSIDENYQIITN